VAVDTYPKRASLLGFQDSFNQFLPIPDSTIDTADRVVLTGLYWWDLSPASIDDDRSAWLGYATPTDVFLPAADGTLDEYDRTQILGMQRRLNVGGVGFILGDVSSATGIGSFTIVGVPETVIPLGIFSPGQAGDFTVSTNTAVTFSGAQSVSTAGNAATHITHGTAWFNGSWFSNGWFNDSWFNSIEIVISAPPSVVSVTSIGSLTIDTQGSYTLSGIEMNGGIGGLSVAAQGEVTVGIAGEVSLASVGDLTIAAASKYTISGNAGTGAVNTFTVETTTIPVDSVQADTGLGTLTIAAHSILSLDGVSANAIYGNISQVTGFTKETHIKRYEYIESDNRIESIKQNKHVSIESRDRRIIVE